MRFRIVIVCMAVIASTFSGCKKPGAAGAAGQMPAPQVIVAAAETRRVVETLPVVANLQANEMVEIKSETDGIVSEIHFEEGQKVEAGQLLIKLDETKFAASLAQTEANFKLSESSFTRAKQLFEDKLIAQQEFDQAAASFQANQANLDFSRRQLRDMRIVAPFEGVVSSRKVSPGQVISRNQVLTWLMDLDPIKVEFEIAERFLGQVAVKQQVQASVAAYPGKKFSGEVFFVSPFVDLTNRTALVKAAIPNSDLVLRPGMFGNMDLILTVREAALVIPESAIMQILDQNKAQVFVVDKSDTAQLRTIQTGLRQPGVIEVTQGLAAGDKVIVEGLQKVSPGGKVRTSAPVAQSTNSASSTASGGK